jgi:hypothetical protein
VGARAFALVTAIAGSALLPLALANPGRLELTPNGQIDLTRPISFRGLALLLAADLAAVFSIHLLGFLRRPGKALLDPRIALCAIAPAGAAVGGLGQWLRLQAAEPPGGAPLGPLDLAGFPVAALALLCRILHRRDHAERWRSFEATRPRPEQPQPLPTRIWNGLLFGFILGTLSGAFAMLGPVVLIQAAGGSKGAAVLTGLWIQQAVSVSVQAWALNQGLLGRIRSRASFSG